MGAFVRGDIVRHTLLESEKVVVGVGKDRYLCVRLEDIGEGGRIRTNARVAMHQGHHLRKVGHHEDVIAIDINALYEKEKLMRHSLRHRWLRQEILVNTLFVLAMLLIVMAVFSGIETARRRVEQEFLKKTEDIKNEYRKKIKKEIEQNRHEEKQYTQ